MDVEPVIETPNTPAPTPAVANVDASSGKWVDDTMNYDWSCGWNSETQDWHKWGTNGCITGPNAVPQPADEPTAEPVAEPNAEPQDAKVDEPYTPEEPVNPMDDFIDTEW